jgi:ribosomal protein S18 acetylase RimI-like enzyme
LATAELERCLGFLRGLAEGAAPRTVSFPFGVAFLDDRVPRVWSRNYLLAEKQLEQATVEALAAEADRLLGGAGLRHRRVEIHDSGAGTRLVTGFRALGWRVECDVVMVARRDPDRQPGAVAVEEVTIDELAPAWIEANRSDPSASFDDEVARQLVEGKRAVAAALPTRFFCGRVDGEIASYCELYSDGRTAQIENVLTLDRFRNRGLARAVVSHALDASRRGGADLTFLVAMRDDWPKELYRKLGFDEVGLMYDFLRPPDA